MNATVAGSPVATGVAVRDPDAADAMLVGSPRGCRAARMDGVPPPGTGVVAGSSQIGASVTATARDRGALGRTCGALGTMGCGVEATKLPGSVQ
jgi:hypothetical protein